MLVNVLFLHFLCWCYSVWHLQLIVNEESCSPVACVIDVIVAAQGGREPRRKLTATVHHYKYDFDFEFIIETAIILRITAYYQEVIPCYLTLLKPRSTLTYLD